VHEPINYARQSGVRHTAGYELIDAVHPAILATLESAWASTLARDDSERESGQVTEIHQPGPARHLTPGVTAARSSRAPHPGAQFSFINHDGHRFQAILLGDPRSDIAELDRRHRARAHIDDHIRTERAGLVVCGSVALEWARFSGVVGAGG
jgi:hypothetical protein